VLGNSLRQTWNYANSLARLDQLRVGTASSVGRRPAEVS